MARIFSLGIFPWNWKPYYFSITYFVFACLGLFLPGSDLPDADISIPFLDKAIHFTIFAGIVFSFLWDYYKRKPSGKNPLFYLLSAMVVLALFSEFAQGQWLNRNASWEDVIADLIGALAGFVLFKFLRNKITTHRKG